MEILTASAAELGRAIDARELEPLAVTQAYLDAVAQSPVADGIYARLTRERALEEAGAASKRAAAGDRLGPLDGVPVSWKDLFDTAGVATEAGSRLLAGRVPQDDCEVLRRAGAAGMVCLGKTHMSELAFSGLGINPVTATPPNRYDPDRAPGGSSSGAAASVALDLAPIAIGSDTGGSVRIPAAWNGLVGLKTTHGVISTEGVVPLAGSFDTVGPLCRTVEDAALMFEILSAHRVNLEHPTSLPFARLLVCETTMLEDCEPEPLRGFEQAVARLEDAGAKIERRPIEELVPLAELSPVLYPYEAYQYWAEAIERSPDAMFAPILDRFRSGRSVSATQYELAHHKMMELRQACADKTERFDAVIAPTVPVAPPKVEPLLADPDRFGEVNLMALRNTRLVNMLGCCALTLPTGVDAAGIMFIAGPNREEHLLQLGMAAEMALSL